MEKKIKNRPASYDEFLALLKGYQSQGAEQVTFTIINDGGNCAPTGAGILARHNRKENIRRTLPMMNVGNESSPRAAADIGEVIEVIDKLTGLTSEHPELDFSEFAFSDDADETLFLVGHRVTEREEEPNVLSLLMARETPGRQLIEKYGYSSEVITNEQMQERIDQVMENLDFTELLMASLMSKADEEGDEEE